MEDTTESVPHYEEHIVAFIDLLGFSDATQIKGKEEIYIEILNLINSLKSEGTINVSRNESGLTIDMSLAVSAFSDCIVLSMPTKAILDHTSNPYDLILLQFDHYISFIAKTVFPLGLLYRGGITIGKLYHKNGVVFGEALIEAYKIEKEVAVYPRIIYSQKLLNILQKKGCGYIREDEDGLCSFKFVHGGFVRLFVTQRNNRDYIEQVHGINYWLQRVSDNIADNIELHAASGDLKKLAKWEWAKKLYVEWENSPYIKGLKHMADECK